MIHFVLMAIYANPDISWQSLHLNRYQSSRHQIIYFPVGQKQSDTAAAWSAYSPNRMQKSYAT